MNYDDARHLLLLHGSGTYGPAGEPLIQEDGFLGSLRPYRGLVERNFHLVMEALLSVGERFGQNSQVDREFVHSLWSMCLTARHWGLHREGMLQRNRLITPTDTVRLERWIETIENTALLLLKGRLPYWAAHEYALYVKSDGWGDSIDYFIPLMVSAVSDPDARDWLAAFVDALGRLGERAAAALPALREAEKRVYTWATPVELCTAQERARIRRAIEAIEGGNRPLSEP